LKVIAILVVIVVLALVFQVVVGPDDD